MAPHPHTPHTTAPATEPPPYDRCDWHDGPSGTAQPIRLTERASRSGAGLYACAPCREQHHLVRLVDIPLNEWLTSMRHPK